MLADETGPTQPPAQKTDGGAAPEAGDQKAKPLFDDEGNQPTKGSMRIRVVDSQGQPVSGANIQVSVWTHDEKFKSNRDYQTDANGEVETDLPSTLSILRLWARKAGYVTIFQHWEKDPPAKRKAVPEEFTFHLKTGTVIGGTVVDEDGQPITGETEHS